MDILTSIHKKLDTLSKGKQRIARYLLEFCEQAAFQTAAEVGKIVDVSESTVVRFAADLGYKGYPEMQKALQEVVHVRLKTGGHRESRTAKEDLVDSVLQGEIDGIRATMEALDRRAFSEAVETLLQARRIYILGTGSSVLPAEQLNRSLQLLFADVSLIMSGEEREMLRRLVHIAPGDVLVFIGFSPCIGRKALEFARQSGAQIIALTDCEADYADIVLQVKGNHMPLADSAVAPLCVIHALTAAISARREQETAEILERIEEIWDVYHV